MAQIDAVLVAFWVCVVGESPWISSKHQKTNENGPEIAGCILWLIGKMIPAIRLGARC